MSVDRIALSGLYNRSINATNEAPIALTKSHNSLVDQGNTSSVVLYLSAEDFARLKNSKTIAKSAQTTFITLQRGAVFNPFNQANRAINASSALAVQSFSSDVTAPYLVKFTLDFDAGLMSLTFSEPMDFSSLTLEGLALQAKRYTTTQTDVDIDLTKFVSRYYRLEQNDEVQILQTSNFNRTVTLQLGISNMNAIKVINYLAVSTETCYLSAFQSFVRDSNGNNVSLVGIDQLNGLRAAIYYPDVTPPVVESWNFDHNTGRTRVQFSETVNIVFMNFSSFVFTNVPSLKNATADGVEVQSLRVDSPTNQSLLNTDNIIFHLSNSQLDTLKGKGLSLFVFFLLIFF